MFIDLLRLKDFRNYGTAEVKFDPAVNVILGKNAQGKTNMLEALYYSGVGKSFRTPRERELIKNGEQSAYIKVVSKKNSGSDTVESLIDLNGKKRVAINALPITRMGELMGVCGVVLFTPDELKIVKESPENRRRFLNIALSQMSKAYFYLLTRYNKTLVSRNKLLKSGKCTEDDLCVWDTLLAQSGAKIIKARRGFTKSLNEHSREFCAKLGDKDLRVEYEGVEGTDAESISAEFINQLKKDRAQDLKYGFTHTGPHKDDISIILNGQDLRSFGSQGQQRSAALALKFAEAEILKGGMGEYPVLLLDDVMSELDITRQKTLISLLEGKQAVITATEAGFIKNANIITIENGQVIK